MFNHHQFSRNKQPKEPQRKGSKFLKSDKKNLEVEVKKDQIKIDPVANKGGARQNLENINPPASLLAISEKERFGYVANVPATPKVDVNKLTENYKGGFGEKTEIPFKFRLVVGINKYQSLLDPERAKREVEQSLNKANENVGYSWYAFGYTWHPQFTGKTAERIEKEKKKLKGSQREREEASEYLKQVDRVVTSRENLPYGKFRDMVTRNPKTKEYVDELAKQEKFPIPKDHIYIHTGDPDAEDFTIAEKGEAGSDRTPLFDKYQKLLSHRVTKDRKTLNPKKYKNFQSNYRKPAPDLISGGYSLEIGRSAGVTQKDKLSELAATIDMSVRRVMAKQNPLLPYYPEPNTLVRWQSLLQNPNNEENYKNELFGIWGSEGDKLKRELLSNWESMGKGEKDKAKATFKPQASIPTGAAEGGERLKAKELNITDGEWKTIVNKNIIPASIVKKAWKNVLASGQNHANPQSWITKVANTYNVSRDEVKEILITQTEQSIQSQDLKDALKELLNNIKPDNRMYKNVQPKKFPTGQIENLAYNTLAEISKFKEELNTVIADTIAIVYKEGNIGNQH